MVYRCCLQVDDGEYFQTLPENSVFIFLRSGEIWRPEGTDAVRAGKFLENLNYFLWSSKSYQNSQMSFDVLRDIPF